MPKSQPRAAASAPPCARRAPPAKTSFSIPPAATSRWFHAGGTTTIEAKSGYGLTLEDECKIAASDQAHSRSSRVPTFLGAHEIPDEYRGRPSEYADLVIHEMLPR